MFLRCRMCPRPVAAAAVAVVLSACAGATDGPDGSGGRATGPTPGAAATAAPDGPVVHATEVPPLHPSVDDYADQTLDIVTHDGTTHRIAVKVARSRPERQHGLMEVPSLPDGVGMIFVGYEEDRSGGFWMKGTLVPLTIAYLAEDGTIVDLVDMEPCTTDDCPTYPPDAPYRSALEMRRSWFAEQGIAVGDVVRRDG